MFKKMKQNVKSCIVTLNIDKTKNYWINQLNRYYKIRR